jgi:hypothetical protein
MNALGSRFAGRVSAIQRKVSAAPVRRTRSGGGGSSFLELSARLSKARKQVAAARRGR